MSDTNLTGRTAGTYRIQDKLGEGGMGAVYRGVDTMVERTVAVKVLKPEIAGNPEIVERFRTEAVTLARLNHPSIATLYTFFREGSDYFMVMEFVSGSTLEDAIRRAGALPWRQATDIMIHILEALQHAPVWSPASRYQARQHHAAPNGRREGHRFRHRAGVGRGSLDAGRPHGGDTRIPCAGAHRGQALR
jgi:serine/threonine protein kinase